MLGTPLSLLCRLRSPASRILAPRKLVASSISACVVAAVGIRDLLSFGALRRLEVALETAPALLVVIFQLWAVQRVLHDPRDVTHLRTGDAPLQLCRFLLSTPIHLTPVHKSVVACVDALGCANNPQQGSTKMTASIIALFREGPELTDILSRCLRDILPQT